MMGKKIRSNIVSWVEMRKVPEKLEVTNSESMAHKAQLLIQI